MFNISLHCKSLPTVGVFQSCYLNVISLTNSRQGRLLEKAKIKIGGGMPAHHHGLPTEPVIKWSKACNKYLIEGLRFSMPGKWILHFYINDKDNTIKDVASFNITI